MAGDVDSMRRATARGQPYTAGMTDFVLIDGSAYLYRAYHALPPLTAPNGEPSGALFGVFNMLRATLKQAPAHLAFVLDASGPTFRDALDPDYKAQRAPMPDDLRAQVGPLIELVTALGIPLLRVPGVEADDVIGTLALQGLAAGMTVEISTGDKDFAQLLRPGLALVNTMSGSRLDSDAAVVEKFGVSPAQIVDYLALMGDKVDNIRGVDKCGPKTAAKWLQQHGTLDGVIAVAAEMPGKIGESLREALPRLPLNRTLATIRTDVALDLAPAQLLPASRDTEALRAFYARYGFRQALAELEGKVSAGGAARPAATHAAHDDAGGSTTPTDPALAAPGRYECVLDVEALLRWCAALASAECIALDTETDGLDPLRARLVGISVAVTPGEAAYIPLAHEGPGAPPQLALGAVQQHLGPLLADPARPKVGQHGKFDLHVLGRHGLAVAGYADDTLLESFVLEAGQLRHDMDSLAERHLGYRTISYTDVTGKGSKAIAFSQVALDDATRYAAEDADITLRLHHVLAPRLAAAPRLETVYREIEMPLVPVLARMEADGVLVDAAALALQSADLARRIHAASERAHALAGRVFNLDSPKQLGALLFDEFGLPVVVKTPSGAPSTNEEALEAIADRHELPRVVLEYRALAKLKSTYTDTLPAMINPATGRVHTSYHQAGAATGRLASSDPNLQNIPIRSEDGRRIRSAFIAPPGRLLVACDYSQIELRIMAHLSGDAGLCEAFAQGADIHRATAAEVFGLAPQAVTGEQRRAAKAINFGLIYGMGAFGLARQLGISRGEAQDYIARYFGRYPGVRDYMERTREQAHAQGYVETVFGRRLHLAQLASKNQAQRAGAERAAINAPMQGTAADIIKRAMITVDAWLAGHRARAQMILQVHDELVFEVDADFTDTLITAVREHMAGAAALSVPLVVDVGQGADWDEAH